MHKEAAAAQLLRCLDPKGEAADCVCPIGNDQTDEDMSKEICHNADGKDTSAHKCTVGQKSAMCSSVLL